MPINYESDKASYGDIRCTQCGSRLETWADTRRGCCARCGAAFPLEAEAVRAAVQEQLDAPLRKYPLLYNAKIEMRSDQKARTEIPSPSSEQIELQAEHQAWMKIPSFGPTTFVAKRWLREKIAPADYGPKKLRLRARTAPRSAYFIRSNGTR